MKTDKYNRKNDDLRKAVERRIHIAVLIFLIIGWGTIGGAFICDLYKDIHRNSMDVDMGPRAIKYFIEGKDVGLYAHIREWKGKLLNNMTVYRELVMTFNTILAAAVIFYYSVQESRRGGIPHRTILAYTFGSYTVPILFVNTLILLPICYVTGSFCWNWTACLCILFIYSIQMVIMVSILASTSFQFSARAIIKAEIRQFQMLNKIEKPEEKKTAEQNPLYIWTYLRHHLVEVAVSTELSVDKLFISRKILEIPYRFKRNKMSEKKLKCNKAEKLYEFYYENILRIFKCLNQPQQSEFRNEMYLILYEFLEKLTGLYEGLKEEDRKLMECKSNYLITISGLMNAVLYSNADEAEAFCNYVFNNIVSKIVWNEQISLYILFQEYLYRTNERAIKLRNIKGIENVDNWNGKVEENYLLYEKFWNIWMEYTTVLPNIAWRYFYEAIRALDGKGNMMSPVAYAVRVVGKVNTYENKSLTNDQ